MMQIVLNRRVKASSDPASEDVVEKARCIEYPGSRRSAADDGCTANRSSPEMSGRVATRGVRRSVSDHQRPVKRGTGNQSNAMKITTISEHGPPLPEAGAQGPPRKVGIRRTHSNSSGCSSTTATTATSKSTVSTVPSPTHSINSINITIGPTTSRVRESKRSEGKQDERKARGIHWNHKVEKKRHIRREDMTPQEREAVWYTEGDSKLILAVAKVTVKMMMRGEPCDDVDFCSRGLEGKTPEGSKRRQVNKQLVRRTLVEEQEAQREEGLHDADYLAEVSITNSKAVRLEARNTALRDEHEARAYLGGGSVLSHRDSLPVPKIRRKKQ